MQCLSVIKTKILCKFGYFQKAKQLLLLSHYVVCNTPNATITVLFCFLLSFYDEVICYQRFEFFFDLQVDLQLVSLKNNLRIIIKKALRTLRLSKKLNKYVYLLQRQRHYSYLVFGLLYVAWNFLYGLFSISAGSHQFY